MNVKFLRAVTAWTDGTNLKLFQLVQLASDPARDPGTAQIRIG